MARRVRALVVGLLATAHAFAPNKPGCAKNVATALNDIVGIAGSIVYAVDNCVPNDAVADTSLACADDIMGALSNSGDAGSVLAAATFNCGNIDSSCAQQILAGISDFTSFGQDIIGATADCPSATEGSGLFCAKSVVSAVDDLVLSAKDIDSAVSRCALQDPQIAPPSLPGGNETDGGELTTPAPDGTATEAPVPEPNLPERRRLALQELVEKASEVRGRLQRLQNAPVVV